MLYESRQNMNTVHQTCGTRHNVGQSFKNHAGTNQADWLRAGRSGDRIPVGARFSVPVQTGLGAHPASCAMGTGSFQGVKSVRGVTLTPHPLLVPWSWKSRAIPLLPSEPYGLYRDLVPAQGVHKPGSKEEYMEFSKLSLSCKNLHISNMYGEMTRIWNVFRGMSVSHHFFSRSHSRT
jgi:hypothetical protein